MLVDVGEVNTSDTTYPRGRGPRRDGDGQTGRNAQRFTESQKLIDDTPLTRLGVQPHFHTGIDKKTWFVPFIILTGPALRIPHSPITAILRWF